MIYWFFSPKTFIPVENESYWANFLFTLVTDLSLLSVFFTILLSWMVLLFFIVFTIRMWFSSRLGRCNEVWTGGYIKSEWRRSGKTKAIFDNQLCPAGLRWRRALMNLWWTELVALQVDSKPLLKRFASRCIVKMSESWLAMGKKCRILALHVVRISLVLWAMFKVV